MVRVHCEVHVWGRDYRYCRPPCETLRARCRRAVSCISGNFPSSATLVETHEVEKKETPDSTAQFVEGGGGIGCRRSLIGKRRAHVFRLCRLEITARVESGSRSRGCVGNLAWSVHSGLAPS